MAKITRHGGPSVHVFQSPATVLRQRGKLGPYGGEVEVVEVVTVEDEDVPRVEEPEPVSGSGDPETDSGGGEPTTADIRAWARDEGYDVAASGKLPQDIVDAYHEAHGSG